MDTTYTLKRYKLLNRLFWWRMCTAVIRDIKILIRRISSVHISKRLK